MNHGGIGSVVGHELTHGFDDQGRKFDPDGNLKDWWTPEDAKEFEKRAECFIDEYSSFTPLDGVHLNGKLTLGENTADNGGVRLSFMALMDALKDKPQPKIDGYTPRTAVFSGLGPGLVPERQAGNVPDAGAGGSSFARTGTREWACLGICPNFSRRSPAM